MLDRDLAALYGVETKRLKEAVRRNIERFPADFMFMLSDLEARYDEQFRVVFEVLNELMAQPEPKRPPIGFRVRERRARYAEDRT